MKNLFKKTVVVGSLLTTASVAMAEGPNYTSITSSLDFSSAVGAVIAVAVAISSVYAAVAGARAVLRMIRGA